MNEKAGALSGTDVIADDDHRHQGLLHPVARSRLMGDPNYSRGCLSNVLSFVARNVPHIDPRGFS